jgi:hypothetical protein
MAAEAEATSTGDPLAFAAYSTPRMKALVARQEAALAPQDFKAFLLTLRSIFEKYTAKLRDFAPGPQRGKAMHHIMDQAIKAGAHLKATCTKGCSGCCHYEVEITKDEADALALVVRGGCAVDATRLQNQAARQRRGPEWNDVLNPSNRCVFLGSDGACRVYESRPMACRRALVTSPAEACSMPGQPVVPIENFLAEILVAASLSLEGSSHGSLSKMLLASLQPARQVDEGMPTNLQEGSPLERAGVAATP